MTPKFVKSSLCIAISTALVFASMPKYALAVSGVAERPLNISAVLSLNDLATNSPLRQDLEGFEKAMESLAQGNIQELDRQGILDPLHLTQQEVRIYKGEQWSVYKLSDPLQAYSPPRTDRLALVVKDGSLVLQGFSAGKLVAERWFKGPQYDSVVNNKKIAVASTVNGDFYVLDYGAILRNQFLGAITPFKALSNPEPSSKRRFQMRFISSGELPLALSEIQSLEDKQGEISHIARDAQGRPLLNAGDLIVSERIDAKLVYRFTLGQKPLLDQVARGSVYLGALAFVSNHEAYQTTLGEEFNRALQVGSEGSKGTPEVPSAAQKILNLVNENGEDLELHRMMEEFGAPTQSGASGNSLDAAKLLLRSIDPQEFKFILSRPDSMRRQKEMPTDELTLLDWHARWEKIRRQAQSESDELRRKLEKLRSYRESNLDSSALHSKILSKLRKTRTEVQLRDLQARLAALETQIESGRFTENQVQFMRSSLLAENSFDEEIKPWREKIDWESLRSLARKTASYAAAGSGAIALGAWSNADFAFAVSTSINWVYQTFMPKIFIHSDQIAAQLGYDYTLPALWGFSKIMSWMLIAHFGGVLSVPLMKSSALATKNIAPNFSHKISSLAGELEGISTWSRIVTLMMRPYAHIFLPFWHYVNKWSGQEILESWRSGLMNPAARYSGDSSLGKKLGLKPGQKLSVGIVNPLEKVLYSQEEREKKELERSRLRESIQYQKRQSFRLATVLVNIVLAEQLGLDHSTLILLHQGVLDLETLKKIQTDPEVRKQWKRGVFSVQQEIWQMLKNKETFGLEQIDSDTFLALLKDAQITVKKVNQSGVSQRILEDLKREAGLVSRQFLAGVANFGKADYMFLKGLVASPFVGRQTAQEAISDHAIIVGMNSFYTLRADPDHIEKLAYTESGAPMHYFNVTMNTIIHLLMAGPRRALVYQSLKETMETAYLPIQSTILSVATKPESFFRGFVHWTLELANLPRSNVGSYYVKEAIKQITTAQAGLALALLGRAYVGEMPMGTALQTTLFYWLAGVIGFAWPWTLVSRGNSLEEARLARESKRHRQAIEKLGIALHQGNEQEIQKQSRERVDILSPESVARAFDSISPQVHFWLNEFKLKEFIRQSASDPSQRLALLVALIEIDRAEKSGSLDDLKSSMNRLTSALHSGDFSSFQTPDVQELGRKLGDIMVADHTVANKANSTLSASIVFIFGAALSTYLASELMDKSFHGNIGVATLGEWALYYFGFLSTVFTLGSKFMWEKYYLPGFEKIHERVSKLVGKEVMPKIKSENLDKSENSEKSRYTRAKQSGQKRCVDF